MNWTRTTKYHFSFFLSFFLSLFPMWMPQLEVAVKGPTPKGQYACWYVSFSCYFCCAINLTGLREINSLMRHSNPRILLLFCCVWLHTFFRIVVSKGAGENRQSLFKGCRETLHLKIDPFAPPLLLAIRLEKKSTPNSGYSATGGKVSEMIFPRI